MMSFVERTGLASELSQKRYLWTDAFAVCNFLGIARATGNEGYTELALRLMDRVHHTLGRHRSDDRRRGWISGLGEEDGASHPTRGGLRIGKKLPERLADEPFEEQLEWERDGQYFHYLTQWMHALDQVARATGERRFNRWARELAEAAYAGFTIPGAGGRRLRMAWTMSIDLSRPLISSMGHHDPLEGVISCAQLRASASELGEQGGPPELTKELSGFASMIEDGDWATTDPLGLGGLLMDACRVLQLKGSAGFPRDEVLISMLAGALEGLRVYVRTGELGWPASNRLAFRELGLCIGLRAIEVGKAHARSSLAASEVQTLLEKLRPYAWHGADIEAFWLEPRHRETRTWLEHRDINEVMLATSLVPEGYALLRPVPPRM